MTDNYLTEQEQIQLLTAWAKRYIPSILLGILIAAILSAGWRYWQNHRNNTLMQASAVYDEMLNARMQNNATDTTTQAKKLLDQYANTPYGEMAALMLAHDAIANKNYPEAIKQFDRVMHKGHTAALREIARLREARLMVGENRAQDALNLLKKVDDKAFVGLIDEIKGDAYLAMNDKESAHKSYELALKELPNAEVTRPILLMKFENLTTESN